MSAARLAAACALAIGIGAAIPVAATELGRLFMTPEERAALDRLREQGSAPAVVEAAAEELPAPAEAAAPPEQPPRITVNGFVRRPDGRSVAWVNGMSTLDGDFAAQHFAVPGTTRGERVRIATPGDLPEVDLKPGQSFEPGTKRIVDARDPPPPPPPP